MSLAEELAQRASQGWADLPPERRAMYERAAEALEASGIEERVLREGDTAPDFELPDAMGRPVRLADLREKGPVIVSFYRGQWCPFCNLELRGLQRALGEVESAGATLVAISPNTPDVTMSTVEKLELEFPVLSDYDNLVAKQFNLVYEMIPENIEMYLDHGRDIGTLNGTGKWELPIPATYVIDRKGMIRYAFVDLNHRRRAEPSEVAAIAADLSG
ncbi:MAG TPA: redoxin domain-containing protein [Acidimicrobiia bacterium]|nr:redoxin domain-containing protein [Acidimicrobiia bacterium]